MIPDLEFPGVIYEGGYLKRSIILHIRKDVHRTHPQSAVRSPNACSSCSYTSPTLDLSCGCSHNSSGAPRTVDLKIVSPVCVQKHGICSYLQCCDYVEILM